jgi:hypothetical protein
MRSQSAIPGWFWVAGRLRSLWTLALGWVRPSDAFSTNNPQTMTFNYFCAGAILAFTDFGRSRRLAGIFAAVSTEIAARLQ